MKNDITSMYYNLIIRKIEKIFLQNIGQKKENMKEFNALYLKTLLTIEKEMEYCTQKKIN